MQIHNALPLGPTSEADLASFERYIGHPLPSEYRTFLLAYNGGHPEPDAFLIDTGAGLEEDIVMCFFPMRPLSIGKVEVENPEELQTWPLHCAWDDLQNDLNDLYAEAGIEEPLLPIGTDGSGNYICLVLDGPRTGAVVFLDHETGATFQLADGFGAFLSSLHPRERVIV